MVMTHVENPANRTNSAHVPGYEVNVSDGRVCRSSYTPRVTLTPNTTWSDYCFAIAIMNLSANPPVSIGASGGYDIYVMNSYSLCRVGNMSWDKLSKSLEVTVTVLCIPN